MLALEFHYEDPDGVVYALNLFLFPDLSPLAGSEADLLTRQLNVVFVGETLTSFSDTSLLLGRQKVTPVEI